MAQVSVQKKKEKPKQSRDLFLAKLFYLIFFAAVGSYIAYFNVFLQSKGFTGSQIGWMGSLPPLVTLVSSPFWSSLAARFQKHRMVAAS